MKDLIALYVAILKDVLHAMRLLSKNTARRFLSVSTQPEPSQVLLNDIERLDKALAEDSLSFRILKSMKVSAHVESLLLGVKPILLRVEVRLSSDFQLMKEEEV